MTTSLGKILLVAGALLAAAGLLLIAWGRLVPGRLPGDLLIQRDNFTLDLPITTMVLLSAVLTLLFNLIGRFFK